jgi:hypothetical protein
MKDNLSQLHHSEQYVYGNGLPHSWGKTFDYKENAVLSGYITTLKNKQKLDVSSEGPLSRVSSRDLTLDEGPSLETSSFCLFFN